MNREEVPGLVALIAALWPHAPQYEAEHMEAFHMVLEPCDSIAVKAALASFARSGAQFPPVAGQLYKRVQDLTNPTPDFAAAWSEVIAWIQSHGRDNPPTQDSFSHPAVYIAAQRLDYRTLCDSNVDDSGVWIAHFRRTYEAAVSDYTDAEPRAALAAGVLNALVGEMVHHVPEDS